MIQQALRIGVTQRRTPASDSVLARDALDATWSDWFSTRWRNSQFLAIPNFSDPVRAVQYVQDWGIDLIVLSGGEDVGTSPIRDAMEFALLAHARSVGQPVIGVCRGMQLMHVACGGHLVQRTGHVAQQHMIRCEQGEMPVNSWHHWSPDSLTPQWRPLAHAQDGSVEAMQHAHLPWLGLMWHPERPRGEPDAMWTWIENNLTTIRGTNDGN